MPDDIKESVKTAVQEALIEAKLNPDLINTLNEMADNYKAAVKVGKWVGGAAVFFSVVFAIWQAIKDLFPHK